MMCRRIVADCLVRMSQSVVVGVSTKELDRIAADFLKKHGARSAPILTYKFPGTTCISVNNDVAHGIPSHRKIGAGDIVNIDVSAELDGYFADTGGSFVVPPSSERHRRVIAGTKAALAAAMGVARHGQPINASGRAIEETAKAHELSIIRNIGSHGVGRALHEEPEFIASYYDPKDHRKLQNGMVITIEPFLSTGALRVEEGEDGWTLYTSPRYVTAQFEHTLVITNGAPLIMTLPSVQVS